MAAYKGVGPRIREQMVKMGYVRADGEPDVQRFCWDFRYDRTLVYAWLSDKATPFKDLVRLTRDLQISVEWLLTGQERTELHGHGPDRGKGSRRQGRRTAGSLVLALLAGLGAALGWPIGRDVAEAGTLPVAQVLDYITIIGRWWPKRWARTLHGSWCLA